MEYLIYYPLVFIELFLFLLLFLILYMLFSAILAALGLKARYFSEMETQFSGCVGCGLC